MRKTLLPATLLLCGASSAQAASMSCEKVGEIARLTMEARQVGVPMRKAMPNKDNPGFDFYRTLIIIAYGRPLYSTSAAKESAVTEFENEIYRECLNGWQ